MAAGDMHVTVNHDENHLCVDEVFIDTSEATGNESDRVPIDGIYNVEYRWVVVGTGPPSHLHIKVAGRVYDGPIHPELARR